MSPLGGVGSVARPPKLISFGWGGDKCSQLDWLLPLLPDAHRCCEPLGASVPNVLESFDLPDCYGALEKKGLRQIDPCGPDGKPL